MLSPCLPPQNFAGECVHFKYFVTRSEISECTIEVSRLNTCMFALAFYTWFDFCLTFPPHRVDRYLPLVAMLIGCGTAKSIVEAVRTVMEGFGEPRIALVHDCSYQYHTRWQLVSS